MDITPQDDTTKPISDDQELAKALAGIAADEPEAPAAPVAAEPLAQPMQFEETPVTSTVPQPTPAVVPDTTQVVTPADDTALADDGLDGIKRTALDELRPLIDRVDLPAEEKFDTYLMLIRSTDDTSLIAPAHAAAQEITDEKRKAQALLDIIKEIDFLSHNNQ